MTREGHQSKAPLRVVPPGKVLCYVTGKLRGDTPEEHVRQRWARSLVEEYGYGKTDLDVEFPIKMGRARKKPDIVVFLEGQEHNQENIDIIVEAKRADVKRTDRKEGVEQLKSYMAACPSCRFGLWVGSEREAYQRVEEEGKVRSEPVYDVPRRGELQPRRPSFEALVAAHDLKAVLKRCHNYIYGNQGLPKDQAFHELLKVIFCKVYDEREGGGEQTFYVRNEERRSEAGQRRLMEERIEPLFRRVKGKYDYIFPGDDKIGLSRNVLGYVVSEFQRYSFLKTETDIKGEAYEELVGANLRGDRGEFFTPRNVCEMAVRMVFATCPKREWTELAILDPACGTGGFLVTVVNLFKALLEEQEKKKWGDTEKSRDSAAERLRVLCDGNLYGVDLNPLLVRACQMNLVMHGNGSGNVLAANSLIPPGEWPEENDHERSLKRRMGLGKFDLVFTNPPFGSKIPIDDPYVLDQFQLSRFEAKGPRSSMPPEQLFIERCLQFLKPGGRLAIVLPDSILGNPGLVFIRRWILKNARIIASIDLPTETFEPWAGTQTSILILQKKGRDEIEAEEKGAIYDYEVFMAIAETVGHDRRGNKLALRTPEGEEILDPLTQELLIDDQLPEVASLFDQWIENKGLIDA